MKKNLLLCLLVFALTNLSGQSYYVVNFTGTGANPETVSVVNQTQGTSVSMQGSDILHLILSGTSINESETGNQYLKIYPNPMDEMCYFEFFNSTHGLVSIHLFSAEGRLIHNFSRELASGSHGFQLSGLQAGIYFLNIHTEKENFSGRFVSTSKSNYSFALTHISETPIRRGSDAGSDNFLKRDQTPNKGTKAIVEMNFATGDQLRFIGMASGYANDTVYASPTGNQTINFIFVEQFVCGVSNVTFNYNGVQVTYGTVLSLNGRCWLDRNLGASQVATSSLDVSAFGDLFQWGRLADGHQARTSGTTTNVSNSDVPGHGNFILANSVDPNLDWRSPQNDNLWQGVSGINNPCPVGWRLPADSEWQAELSSWSSSNSAGAYASPLKLPAAGLRETFGDLDTYVNAYWGSTPKYTIYGLIGSSAIAFDDDDGFMGIAYRSTGFPVRCIKECPEPLPDQPSAINGNSSTCEGTTGLTYSVTNESGVTYTWTVPSGWSITSGQGTNSIIVTAGSSSGNIEVTPSNSCGSGTSRTLAVTTQSVPAQPSTISGSSIPCSGSAGNNYSVTNVSGVNYSWTVPSGWTITSGHGTYSINVTAGTTPGDITATPSNSCGSGPIRTLSVSSQTAPAPTSSISGDNNPCSGTTGLIYSVTNVSGVTYNWVVPSGWAITSGQGTNSITVTSGSTSGSIVVTPSNICGSGVGTNKNVSFQSIPSQPSAISGNSTPCSGSAGLTYSVTNVSGVSYAWTVPSGWTITSGQGTNSITVTAGTSSGNIAVTPSNSCGGGTSRSLSVSTQSVPAQPSTISGNSSPCSGTTGLAYSVTNVTGVTYNWTVPSGWTITSGQGTNSITVSAGSSSGSIVVTPSNGCGNGTVRSLTISTLSLPSQPSTISGNNNPCSGTTGLAYSVTNVTGVTYNWTVPSGWTITSGQGTNSITVTAGTSSGNIAVTPSNTCGSGTLRSLAVSAKSVPAQPSTINGEIFPCEGATGLVYSVTNVSGVTYTWTVPTSWTITSGQGTNSITVNANSSGNIVLTPSNNCGNGPTRMISITTQTAPAQPSTISGNTNPCGGASGLTYSVTNVTGVNYAWTVPSGWTITSGQGTNSITVKAGTTSGYIVVTPSNSCGNGSLRNLAVGAQTVTFTYKGSSVTYGTITGANGRCWLNRNLGATQVATSSTDVNSYGDIFQWGRADDGHQTRTSPVWALLSSGDSPGHNFFITPASTPYDWRSPQNNNLWQGIIGTNNPCPSGWRLPTEAEWDTERLSWSNNNAAGAFASPLKLPVAGSRDYTNGSLYNVGHSGYYWSSTITGVASRYLMFYSTNAIIGSNYRAYGSSVRCIKN